MIVLMICVYITASVEYVGKEESTPSETSYALALASVVARLVAVVAANPVLVAVHIQTHQPSVQDLVKIVQVLGHAIALTLRRARVVFCETLVVIKAAASSEPAIVGSKGSDRISVR